MTASGSMGPEAPGRLPPKFARSDRPPRNNHVDASAPALAQLQRRLVSEVEDVAQPIEH